MNICYRSTDPHRCLSFSSNHANHCKKNIPFTLTRRICTIVENTEAKIKHLKSPNKLKQFQYPKQLTDCAIKITRIAYA